MSSEIALRVSGVTKVYEMYATPARRLAQLLWPRRRFGTRFEALKSVSFEIPRGGFFGIVGQNGSGKSTLLQIVSGILEPTAGTVEVKGRVAALLELGAGFNPEFTGRENARLNAHILGISGAEFDRVLPEIEAFADIGDFIDQPVKTYSSGMFVRLAFAVQACIDPDVLIVDEALAVGDIFFRLRCYDRLNRLRKNGCTVILVTHSMEDVLHYCDQVLLLHRGEALYCGDPVEAVNRYYALGQLAAPASSAPPPSPASDAADDDPGAGGPAIDWPDSADVDLSGREQVADAYARCLRAAVTADDGRVRRVFRQGETMQIRVEFEVLGDIETPSVGFVIRTDKGVIVHGRHSGQSGAEVPARVRSGTRVRALHEVRLDVGPGEYVVDLGFATWPAAVFAHRRTATMAELEATAVRHCVVPGAFNFSVVPRGEIGFDAQPFYGIAGLDSHSRLAVSS